MKTLFALYISAVGPTYNYAPVITYADLAACVEDARWLSDSDYHAYCAVKPPSLIDGSVRPVARPMP